MGCQPNPYIAEGEAAALLPGGRPVPAAPLAGGLGAGRPAAGRPVLQGPGRKFSAKFFTEKPCRPTAGRPGYIPVNFKNKNIFL